MNTTVTTIFDPEDLSMWAMQLLLGYLLLVSISSHEIQEYCALMKLVIFSGLFCLVRKKNKKGREL